MGENIMSVSITAASLRERLAKGEIVEVVDVRREADFNADPDMFGGARKLDAEHVARWAGQLPKGAPVAVYCAHGGAISQKTAEALVKLGVDAVYVEGGHDALKALAASGQAGK
jgi:rhodanese-related sulfurtransferase